jgi:hypothetical protein
MAERQREVTRQHDNQPNNMGAIGQQDAEALAEGFSEVEWVAHKRRAGKSGNRVAGCVMLL